MSKITTLQRIMVVGMYTWWVFGLLILAAATAAYVVIPCFYISIPHNQKYLWYTILLLFIGLLDACCLTAHTYGTLPL